MKAFAKANDWYRDEPDMAEYADKWSVKNAELNDDISFEDNMKATVEAVKRKFPDRFKTAANGHAAVDAGGAFSGSSKSDPLAGYDAIVRAKAKSDMKAFPSVYPTAESWIATFEGKK